MTRELPALPALTKEEIAAFTAALKAPFDDLPWPKRVFLLQFALRQESAAIEDPVFRLAVLLATRNNINAEAKALAAKLGLNLDEGPK